MSMVAWPLASQNMLWKTKEKSAEAAKKEFRP